MPCLSNTERGGLARDFPAPSFFAPHPGDKSWYFKSAPIFAGAGAPLLERLAAVSTMRRVRPGGQIYLAGDPAATVYLLKEGQVRLAHLGPDGEETTIAVLGPLDIFGERAIAGDEARSETATAVTSSLICDIPRAEFLALLEVCQALRVNVFRLFIVRTARLESRLIDLVFKGAEARLCTVLLQLGADRGRPALEGALDVPVAVSTRELGRLAGLGRQTTSTLLSALARVGLVERHLWGLRLRGLERLRARAER